jgi:hypothetical protein
MTMRKIFTAPALGLALAALVAATPVSADWQGRHGGHGHWRQGSRGLGGGAIAAGIIGGLALGALAASASRRSYAAPAYAMEPDDDYDAPVCHREVRPVHDAWGRYVGERVRRICY